MSRLIRVSGVVVLLVALGAIVGTGVAGAKKKKVHGQLTISYEYNPTGTDRFTGTISSPNPRCARGATVDLGYKPAFEGGGGSDVQRVTVASGVTDAQGNWQIPYEVAPNGMADFQSYSASSPVRLLKTKTQGVKIACKNAASEVITLFPG